MPNLLFSVKPSHQIYCNDRGEHSELTISARHQILNPPPPPAKKPLIRRKAVDRKIYFTNIISILLNILAILAYGIPVS
jgi:hypothetical protein